MPIPNPLSRLPTAREIWLGLRLALVLFFAASGTVLLTDRLGLEAEYFALGAPWQGRVLTTAVGAPRLHDVSEVRDALKTQVVFSIRWSGWWDVAQEGEHQFALEADDGGYLRIDDELVVDTSSAVREQREGGRKRLSRGFHTVEVGLHQVVGDSRLAVIWRAPGSPPEATANLPIGDLFSSRPLALRKYLRLAVERWPEPYRRLLGTLLLLIAWLLVAGRRSGFEGCATWLRPRLEAIDRRSLRPVLLLGLFVLTFLACFPFTGTLIGGDDTMYLRAATFNLREWFFGRYAHVYLIKLFTTLSGGDPLVGVRVWWSFVMAATVAALAVAVKSVGPGLQLRTLAATLFVLLAQPTLFGLIGFGFADFSSMLFVTVAVATYMHGVASAREHPTPRHDWHELAIGALTVGAFRSKEVGAVLALLPMLFLLGPGSSLDLRRFVRKMIYWTAGAALALSALMLLDGWLLGDFFFTFDPRRLAGSKKMNFPGGVPLRHSNWFDNIWLGLKTGPLMSTRNLWVGVCAGAIAAGVTCRKLELRLLHFLPIAYLTAIIALYVRLPHPVSNRMLIPILPVACLMTALLLHHAGLDAMPWRQLLRLPVLIPGAVAAAVVCLIVVPYRLGTVPAASFIPVDLVRRFGWEPDYFVGGVLLPIGVLLALSAVAMVADRPQGRLLALLVVYALFFGPGFEITRTSLVQHRAVQTGDLLVYPWRAFRDELNAVPPGTGIALSRDLAWTYNMSTNTRSALARLALRRSDLSVASVGSFPAEADLAIASRNVYREWVAERPALAATATFDPGGFLVLVRPKDAAELTHPDPAQLAEGPPQGLREKSLEERLDELRLDRSPEARRSVLQVVLDRIHGPSPGFAGTDQGRPFDLSPLNGDQLRGLALSSDGWTEGTRAAGLIVDNQLAKPLAQPLSLGVRAPESEYPIRVFVDNGDELETFDFHQPGSRMIELRPVPPGAVRLFTVWSDKGWISSGGDGRLLGVRILAPSQP